MNLKTLILLLLLPSLIFSQEATEGSIIADSLNECMDSIIPFDVKKAFVCIEEANKKSELEMISTYEKLLNLTDNNQAVIHSQEKWIEYRNAQSKMIMDVLDFMSKDYPVERRLVKFSLNQERTDHLKSLIDAITN